MTSSLAETALESGRYPQWSSDVLRCRGYRRAAGERSAAALRRRRTAPTTRLADAVTASVATMNTREATAPMTGRCTGPMSEPWELCISSSVSLTPMNRQDCREAVVEVGQAPG